MIPTHLRPKDLDQYSKETIAEHLEIKFTGLGSDWIQAQMPVSNRTRQPHGILHGGASVVLAETLGSVGSQLIINEKDFRAAGLEINANHVRSISSGTVSGLAKIVHAGRSTHIWDIRITDESDNLLCISRLTVAILKVS